MASALMPTQARSIPHFALPSYNPNVGALAVTYDSLTANTMAIIVVPHSLDPSQAVPTKVGATLTFNGTALTTEYYDTSQWTPGDVEQISLQATNATALATGRYAYSVQIVDYRTAPTTFTYSGTATVLSQTTSAFGDGWTLQRLEQITTATGGVILNTGSGGASLWFSGSPGVGGSYTSPAGDFSTLTKTSTGFTRTLANGTQITFNSNGNQSATIDLNGLHTTYTFSSGLLTKSPTPTPMSPHSPTVPASSSRSKTRRRGGRRSLSRATTWRPCSKPTARTSRIRTIPPPV